MSHNNHDEAPNLVSTTTTTTAATTASVVDSVDDLSLTPPPPQKQHPSILQQPSSLVSCSTPTPTTSISTSTDGKKKSIEHILLQQGLVRKMMINPTTTTQSTSTVLSSLSTPKKKEQPVSRVDMFATPTNRKIIDPSLPPPPTPPPSQYKTIYFIRHGESLGQLASTQNRRQDMNLKDCGLSPLGIQQSKRLHDYFQRQRNMIPPIELVLCSPLTRAIQTALLVFGRNDDDNEYNDECSDTKDNTENNKTTAIVTTTTASHKDSSEDSQDCFLPPSPITHPVQQQQRPKILIHYHLREMGSNIPENQPRTMKQVCDYCIQMGTIRQRSEWDTLIDTISLQPPPPVSSLSSSSFQSTTPHRYSKSSSSSSSSLSSPSPMKKKQQQRHRNTAMVDDDSNDTTTNDNTRSAHTEYDKNTTSKTIHGSWPYTISHSSIHSTDTTAIPSVLRRDYIQYMLHWIALHRHETNIAIVCHYFVIRAALASSSLPSNSSHNCTPQKKTNRHTTTKTTTPAKSRKVATDVQPQNAEPIKCYLCTLTGQITLASVMDKVQSE